MGLGILMQYCRGGEQCIHAGLEGGGDQGFPVNEVGMVLQNRCGLSDYFPSCRPWYISGFHPLCMVLYSIYSVTERRNHTRITTTGRLSR
jgi:hypothetical protein